MRWRLGDLNTTAVMCLAGCAEHLRYCVWIGLRSDLFSEICEQWEHGCGTLAGRFKYYSRWSREGHPGCHIVVLFGGKGMVFGMWEISMFGGSLATRKVQLQDHRI